MISIILGNGLFQMHFGRATVFVKILIYPYITHHHHRVSRIIKEKIFIRGMLTAHVVFLRIIMDEENILMLSFVFVVQSIDGRYG